MTVRFVVLGCGRIGSMHAAYLHRRVAGAKVVGVFDVVAEAAESVGAELGVPVAADLEAALAIDADAVAICTSTDTHVEVMIAAAEAGRAIFCEKPVSLDVAEVDRALAAIEAAGVPLHIGFNRRFDPSHKAVADAVADGAIGDVEVVNITSRDPAPPPIAYIEVSGGIFNDMAIHDFDMARFVTGSEVESVYALGRVRVDPAIGEAGDVDTRSSSSPTRTAASPRSTSAVVPPTATTSGSRPSAVAAWPSRPTTTTPTPSWPPPRAIASPHSRTSSLSATPPAISISGRHSLPPLRTAPRHRSAVPTVELRSSSAWPPSARWTKANPVLITEII